MAMLFGIAHAARGATTITVNTTSDELAADGNCSLREAISAANTDAAVDGCPAGSGADTIVVPAGSYALSIAGAGEDANASGDLDITSDLTISGAGQAATIIDAASVDRVFDVDPSLEGVVVQITGVTSQHGLASGDLAAFGGGIRNAGTLTLNESTVRSSTGIPLDVFGGGIANLGTLTLNDSTVSKNGSQVQGVLGGGIGNFVGATATLNRSTVSGNSTGSFGGGIRNLGLLTIANSTVSGNTAFGGGGIQNGIDDTVAITNSTVTANQAAFGGGLLNNGLLTLKNTIVGTNTAGGDCLGAPTSLGHNLDGDGSCGLTAAGDISNTDPRLGSLADNGGLTQTHALLSDSPAIDAGSADCPPPASDQRGVPRPQGAACDIGAFELASVPFAAFAAKLEIKLRPRPSDDQLDLNATFTLGAGSDGIQPTTEDVNLSVAALSLTVPAGSFVQNSQGRFTFSGSLPGGVVLDAQIRPLGGGVFNLQAEATHVDLAGTTNPVPITLAIGNDFGATTAIAELKR
jgi:CSLREA domain-containing protein